MIQGFMLFLCVPSLLISSFLSWYRINEPAFVSLGYNYFPDQSFYSELERVSWWGKIVFFIADNVAIFFLSLALWYFWQQLTLYKRALYFTPETIINLKKIMHCLLGWSIYQLLFPTLASLIISCFRITGRGSVVVRVSSDDVVRFFVVLILCVVLHVMQEAYRIKGEQDLVV
jgi:hypothetical protein